MTKTIVVDGKEIVLKTSGLVPLLYKKEFKRDFFTDVFTLRKGEIDSEILYYLVWTFARAADSEIKELNEWLDGFERFNVLSFSSTIIELVTFCLSTTKKTPKNNKAAVKH